MSKIKDSFFGGAEASAADAQKRGLRQQAARLQEATEAARPFLQEGFGAGREEIERGRGVARGDISAGAQQGVEQLQPFRDIGLSAFEEQAALLGLSDDARNQEALDRFESSPGQQFLREEQERATIRNQAATGGTQGGNVLKELQRQAFGRAQADFGNQFSRLQQLGSQGQTAASNIASIFGQEGANLANVETGTAGALAQLFAQEGQSIANLEVGQGTQIGQVLANIGSAQAAGIVGQAAGFRSGLRETVSLASGEGGFGAPSIGQVAQNFQQGASAFSSVAGGFGGAG